MNNKETSRASVGVWIRLLKAHNMIFNQVRGRLSEHCTMSQFDILAQLSREESGTPLVELSRRLLVTAGNVTGMIDRMEKAELVRRSADPSDRRITRVHLTDKGKLLARKVIPTHSQDIQRIFDPLKEKEIVQLRKLLDKLIAGMENGAASKF